ncbi:unnamed protein product, partial [Owenia fusiformis]
FRTRAKMSLRIACRKLLDNVVRKNQLSQVRCIQYYDPDNKKPVESVNPEETTDYEVSKEEWKYVDRLLPLKTLPEPPKYSSYPTPSGWIPQKDENIGLPYSVRRSRFHMLPVYLEEKSGGTRKITIVKKVEGDIWAFEADIRKHLEELTSRKVTTQVHEITRFLRIKGIYLKEVSDFLISKGF